LTSNTVFSRNVRTIPPIIRSLRSSSAACIFRSQYPSSCIYRYIR
jgi:hypothetical protein